MITFETKRHIEIDENYQGVNLTEFAIKADNNILNEDILESFIRSTSFKIDSLREVIKNNTERKPYLKRAFDIDRINVADFKKKSKEEIAEFLYDFINQPDWGDDRNDFKKLLDRYFEIHKTSANSGFYIISKDWFDKDDKKVIEPESWVYTYYFLIISVDRNSNLLTLSEWTYD